MLLWQDELLSVLGSGKVFFSDVHRELYASAACIYDILPLAVVEPSDSEDISKTVQICSKYHIPVIPRGAGSSLAGQVVGEAVILDLSRSFRQLEFQKTDVLRIGTSWVLDEIDSQIKHSALRFAVDPSSSNVATLGGVIANNSGGPHSLQHGNAVNHLERVDMILADGEPFSAINISIDEIHELDERHRYYYEKVLQLLDQYSQAVSEEKPRVHKHSTGYQVWDLLEGGKLNLAKLFAGSEGTLGIIYQADLKLLKRPIRRIMIPVRFETLSQIGKVIPAIVASGASAIEFVDASFIRFAREFSPDSTQYLPEDVRYLIWVEYEIFDETMAEFYIARCNEAVANLGVCDQPAFSESEIKKITSVRRAALGILNRMTGDKRPIPFVEDAVIPPENLVVFLPELDEFFRSLDIDYVVWGHIGSGNLHIRPLIDLKANNLAHQVSTIMDRFTQLVIRHQGMLSGEHGDGRLRTPFLQRVFPQNYPLFRELKELFDPEYIFNPDVKVSKKTYHWFDHNRYQQRSREYPVSRHLNEKHWVQVIDSCHGCGTCREYCPVFKADSREAATGRAKANLLRSILNGRLPGDRLYEDESFKIFELCFNCGQCITDCPTGVDIPAIALLARSKGREKRGYSLGESLLMNGKLMSEISGFTSPLSNIALKNKVVRKGLDRIAGIDQRREFPTFERTAYDSQTFAHKSRSDGRRVVLWTGCHAQHSDPGGEVLHTVQLLEKLGYSVIFPEWRCCNIARLTHGDLTGSLDDLQQNMEILVPYAEQGIPIVFTSASCGYAFRKEYPKLFSDHDDVKKVAEASIDVHDFILEILKASATNIEFKPIRLELAYHEPCHLKAQKNGNTVITLLKMVPGLKLLEISDHCCGIAGTFGMKSMYYDLSMVAGEPLFSEIRRVDPQIVVSGCGTCQLQIRQGTGIDAIHPIILLNRSISVRMNEKSDI